MTNPTPEEVRASIVPKSDQLNADDLNTGPVTVTIENVRKGDREKPIFIDLAGYRGRPYKPGIIYRRILVAVFSDDPKPWIGQRMTLWRDPEVSFGGVKVGGIAISHLSGLTEPRTFIVTYGRGKRKEVTILPLPAGDDAAYIADAKREIRAAGTMEVLKAIGFILKGKPKSIQDALRPSYAARLKELEA